MRDGYCCFLALLVSVDRQVQLRMGQGVMTRLFYTYWPGGVQRIPRGPFFFLQYPAPMFTQPDGQALPLVGATS